jgi:redox-sensitive bicupin YhaK (pirin superfamily)
VRRDGVEVRVIAGELDGRGGPASTLMPLLLWHVAVEPGATFAAALPDGYEAAAYVIEGEGEFGTERASTGKLVVLAGTEGSLEVANRGTARLELMVLGGTPAEGPLVFHGPFVMNSVEQVRAAEIAYRTGRMGELVE